MIFRNLNAFIQTRQDVPTKLFTVSYTHLDVYKRQFQHTTIRSTLLTVPDELYEFPLVSMFRQIADLRMLYVLQLLSVRSF